MPSAPIVTALSVKVKIRGENAATVRQADIPNVREGGKRTLAVCRKPDVATLSELSLAAAQVASLG